MSVRWFASRVYLPVFLMLLLIAITGCGVDSPTAPTAQPGIVDIDSKSSQDKVLKFDPVNSSGIILAPSKLTAGISTIVEGCAIDLSWIDNSRNESGFRIYRRDHSDRLWRPVGSLKSGSVAFTDHSVRRNVTYFYRVQAFDGIVESKYSNVAEVKAEYLTNQGGRSH